MDIETTESARADRRAADRRNRELMADMADVLRSAAFQLNSLRLTDIDEQAKARAAETVARAHALLRRMP